MIKPLLTLFTVAGLTTSLLAQPQPEASPVLPEHPKQSRQFLGVEVQTVPKALSAQLKLPQGMGLVVTFVVPGGPANTAGVQQYDVLTQYDDQLLADPAQLAALVWNQDVQMPVKLTLRREGAPRQVPVKLEVRELPAPSQHLMEGQMRRLGIPGLFPFKLPLPNPRVDMAITTYDKHGTFTLTNEAGKKIVHFVDPAGTVVFEGEVGHQDDMPPSMREKIEVAERSLEESHQRREEAERRREVPAAGQPEERVPGI